MIIQRTYIGRSEAGQENRILKEIHANIFHDEHNYQYHHYYHNNIDKIIGNNINGNIIFKINIMIVRSNLEFLCTLPTQGVKNNQFIKIQ